MRCRAEAVSRTTQGKAFRNHQRIAVVFCVINSPVSTFKTRTLCDAMPLASYRQPVCLIASYIYRENYIPRRSGYHVARYSGEDCTQASRYVSSFGICPTGMNLSRHFSPLGRDEMSWSDISMSPALMVTSGRVVNLEYVSRRRVFISTSAKLIGASCQRGSFGSYKARCYSLSPNAATSTIRECEEKSLPLSVALFGQPSIGAENIGFRKDVRIASMYRVRLTADDCTLRHEKAINITPAPGNITR